MTTQEQNPHRPTATWKLWTLGIVGGLIAAMLMFVTSGENADATRQTATQTGAWALRGLLVAVILLGGWTALRRR